MAKKYKAQNKPQIETIINSAAIVLSATGTNLLIINGVHWWRGFLLIAFAIGLEWFKYMGRHKELW